MAGLQAYIRQFLEDQERAKTEAREALEREERAIAEYAQQKQQRESQEAALKASKKEKADRCPLPSYPPHHSQPNPPDFFCKSVVW